MKNLVGMLFVIIIMLTSCKKDEMPAPVNVNTDAIKAQLSLVSVPSKEVVQSYLTTSNLKSTTDANPASVLVQIFALEESTYEISDYYAIKNLVYYEINGNNYRQRYLTIKQQFAVNNGVVDTTNYLFSSYEVGCSYSQYFRFRSCNYIDQTIFFFRFDDGRQFSYYGNNDCSVQLPPIAGGKWQVSINYNTDGVNQNFMSQMINFWENYFIELKFQVMAENTVSILEIETSNNDLLKGANYIELVGKDDQNNNVYFAYPFSFDENMPDIISFPAPFNIQRIYICGSYGCWSSYTYELTREIKDGKIIYRIE